MIKRLVYRSIIFLILLCSSYVVGLQLGIGILSVSLSIPAFILFLLFETQLERLSLSTLLWAVLGLAVGTATGLLFALPFRYILDEAHYGVLSFFLVSLCAYGFLVTGIKRAGFFEETVKAILRSNDTRNHMLLLDTNVLIDGRIADIAETGFIRDMLLVPRFVLQEIQFIADSPDPVRRARGRRALEMLKKLQQNPDIKLKISEEDLSGIKDVDTKIIALASKSSAIIITNDYNLQKIAHLQGLRTLNINDLAKSLKSPVLPGETLSVFVIKEGKEQDQGVAYLDDGTMVVIENGRSFLGKTIRAEVTSVLQTAGGRMIFARPIDTLND